MSEDLQQNERYLRDKVERLTKANAELVRERDGLSKEVTKLRSALTHIDHQLDLAVYHRFPVGLLVKALGEVLRDHRV